MRKLLALLAIVSTLLLGGCNSYSDYRMVDGTIVYNTPERAAGQQDMLGFKLPS